MTLLSTCTACGARQPVEAGFLEDDGKRFGALLAGMSPTLGRAAISYLQLWAPPKSKLRLVRAIKIIEELNTLVATGSVCRDERGGARRPATPELWAAGIEQMLAQRDRIEQLDSHVYLRKVVYGLAEQVDARREQRIETERQQGRHREPSSTLANAEDPIQNAMKYAAQMRELAGWSDEQVKAHVDAAKLRHRGEG